MFFFKLVTSMGQWEFILKYFEIIINVGNIGSRNKQVEIVAPVVNNSQPSTVVFAQRVMVHQQSLRNIPDDPDIRIQFCELLVECIMPNIQYLDFNRFLWRIELFFFNDNESSCLQRTYTQRSQKSKKMKISINLNVLLMKFLLDFSKYIVNKNPHKRNNMEVVIEQDNAPHLFLIRVLEV